MIPANGRRQLADAGRSPELAISRSVLAIKNKTPFRSAGGGLTEQKGVGVKPAGRYDTARPEESTGLAATVEGAGSAPGLP